jgi:FtsH ternary system domain X2
MCNPRRIRVRATRELAEAWDQEVRRQATRHGEAVAEVRVREPLEASVGGPTLTALTAVLGRTEGWTQDEAGVFTHQLTGGYLAFDPSTRELEIVARQSAVVSAVGEAATTVRAEVSGTVEAQGESVWYDDGYRGLTQAHAQRAAEQNLDASLSEAMRRRREQARRDTDQAAGATVTEQAEREAEAALSVASAARSEELRTVAAATLVAVGIEGRNLFHHALAEAYRDAILAYAHARRADNVHCSDSGGVVEIEFEMQI